MPHYEHKYITNYLKKSRLLHFIQVEKTIIDIAASMSRHPSNRVCS